MKMSNQFRGLDEEEIGFLTDHKVCFASSPPALHSHSLRKGLTGSNFYVFATTEQI